jgi:hypothetical protein
MTDPNKRKDDREPQKANKETFGNQGNETREIGVEKPRKAPEPNTRDDQSER